MENIPTTSFSLIERSVDHHNDIRKQALNEIAVAYSPYIFGVALRYARDPNIAQDLAQEFIADKVLSGAITRRFDPGKGRFRTYIFTSVRNECRQYYRKSPRDDIYDSKIYAPKEKNVSRNSIDDDLVWAQTVLASAIAETRRKLKANGKQEIWDLYFDQVIQPVLFRVNKTPIEQLTQSTGLSKSQIRGKVQNGKRSLRASFSKAIQELDGQVMISGSRTNEVFELLTSPGAFDCVDPDVFRQFGLDDLRAAIFVSKGPLAELVELNHETKGYERELNWADAMKVQLHEICELDSSAARSTIEEILFGCDGSIEELSIIRQVAKDCLKGTNSNSNTSRHFSAETAKHLYCIAIATNIVKHRETNSTLDSTQLLFNLEKMRNCSSIDSRAQRTATAAISMIKNWK